MARVDLSIKGWLALAMSGAFVYLIGVRGWLIPLIALLLWFPAGMVLVAALSFIVPPRLEPCTDSGEVSHFTSLFPDEKDISSK